MEQRIDGKTMNITQENINKLREIFPEVFTENKIDFDKLQIVLGENIEKSNEKYEFSWNGKFEAMKIAQQQSTGTLIPCKEESKDWDTTENLYIEGDNLEVLKLLQKSYVNSIKMIYIDPPYNTGKDFVYKDNFADNITNYKEITKQTTKSNAETDGRYHTNWLNMMYPRLKLARNLLTDDGSIFISIDDNELENLTKLCDEIFGEYNFVTLITREAIKGGSLSRFLRNVNDYVLVYAKNINTLTFGGIETEGITLNLEDEYGKYAKGRELNKWGAGSRREDSPGMWFAIPGPNGEDVYPIRNDGSEGRWRLSKKNILELIQNHNVIYEKRNDGTYVVYQKIRDDSKRTKQFTNLFIDNYINARGTEEIKDLFNINTSNFDYSKPVKLINDLILMANLEDNDIVLDFFSGSATTAHAVIENNANNGKNNKFICVQLPEKTEEDSEARKTGYNTICEIGKERIRRAGQKIKDNLAHYGKERDIEGKTILSVGTSGDIDYVEYKDNETGEITSESRFIREPKDIYKYNPEKLDIGFKVFKLESSNLNKWDNSPTQDVDNLISRLQANLFYIKEDRNNIDLVYEIMLKYGLPLTLPVQEKMMDGHKVYIIEQNSYKILICLDQNIAIETIEKMTNEPIKTFVFADHCFADANVLINTEEILKKKSKNLRIF